MLLAEGSNQYMSRSLFINSLSLKVIVDLFSLVFNNKRTTLPLGYLNNLNKYKAKSCYKLHFKCT